MVDYGVCSISLRAYELYKVTREFADLKPEDTLYDLYTGTGTIANFCARRCKKVVGIEYVPEAIEDAKINSQINGIDNTSFYAGDMKAVLSDDFVARNGRPDVIILDPPRAGVDEPVIEVIRRAAPERMVYVSCFTFLVLPRSTSSYLVSFRYAILSSISPSSS